MVYVNRLEAMVHLKESINKNIRYVGSETFEGVMVETLYRALVFQAKNVFSYVL